MLVHGNTTRTWVNWDDPQYKIPGEFMDALFGRCEVAGKAETYSKLHLRTSYQAKLVWMNIASQEFNCIHKVHCHSV